MRKNLVLAMPTYRGQIKIDFAVSMFQTIYTSKYTNIKLLIEQNQSLISRARNNLISNFYFLMKVCDIVTLK